MPSCRVECSWQSDVRSGTAFVRNRIEQLETVLGVTAQQHGPTRRILFVMSTCRARKQLKCCGRPDSPVSRNMAYVVNIFRRQSHVAQIVDF
jgi:hypothetical protein